MIYSHRIFYHELNLLNFLEIDARFNASVFELFIKREVLIETN